MRAVRPGRRDLPRCLTGIALYVGIAYCGLVAWRASAVAQDRASAVTQDLASAVAQGVLPAALYPVGMTQMEFHDPAEGGTPLDLMLIYPAAPMPAAVPFGIFLSTNLHLYKDAPIVSDHLRCPLVMFSHGAGGNGSLYAWFSEYLASHGYLVAMVYHFRANTYDSSALYVRNKIWQRPRDISLDISYLLQDSVWGAAHRPEPDWSFGAFAGGIYLPVARWRERQSRSFPEVSARMEEQLDCSGLSARADEPRRGTHP